MSHATSDLEYFKCDMCATYMHKEIYCDHRRGCKGKDSKELTKQQVAAVQKVLDADEHKRVLDNNCESDQVIAPVEQTEKRQLAKVRGKLQEEWLEQKRTEEKAKETWTEADALAFLDD